VPYSETFERDLARGSGCAVLEVLAGDPSDYRDILLRALGENRPMVDCQFEDNRSEYLRLLLNATGEPASYIPTLCKLLDQCTDPAQSCTFVALAKLMADDGHVECRRPLYDAFVRFGEMGEFVGTEEIVELDGTEGVKFIAAHWPVRPRVDTTFAPESEASHIIHTLRDRDGKQRARAQLHSALNAEGISTLLTLAAGMKRKGRSTYREHCAKRRQPLPSHDQMRALIAEHGLRSRLAPVVDWTRRCDEATFKLLAADLLAETDRQNIATRLIGFFSRTFPLDVEKLLEWATDDDWGLRTRARGAAKLVRDLRVRDFVTSRLESDLQPGTLIAMLVANYEPGDETYLWRSMERDLDPYEINIRNSSICEVLEAHWPPSSHDLLVAMFKSECQSNERYNIYKLPRTNSTVPDWMRQEALYDAEGDLRELARADTGEPFDEVEEMRTNLRRIVRH
jgi:hypothetical protein